MTGLFIYLYWAVVYSLLLFVDFPNKESRICIGICGAVLIEMIVSTIEKHRFRNKLALFEKQLSDIPMPDYMEKTDTFSKYGDILEESRTRSSQRVDFIAYMIVKSHRAADEIYNYFNGYTYKSVNRLFKSEPVLNVKRAELTDGYITDELLGICKKIDIDENNTKQYYIVMLSDKILSYFDSATD